LAHKTGLEVYSISFQKYIKLSSCGSLPDEFMRLERPLAICVLNVLHGHWADPNLRTELIETCMRQADFFVGTFTKKDANSMSAKLHSDVRPLHADGFASKWKLDYSQYHRTFFFKGFLGKLESVFWRIANKSNGEDLIDPTYSYQRLVGIIDCQQAQV